MDVGVIECISCDGGGLVISVAITEARRIIVHPRDYPSVLVHLPDKVMVRDVRHPVVHASHEARQAVFRRGEAEGCSKPCESVHDEYFLLRVVLSRGGQYLGGKAFASFVYCHHLEAVYIPFPDGGTVMVAFYYHAVIESTPVYTSVNHVSGRGRSGFCRIVGGLPMELHLVSAGEAKVKIFHR